jgi:hypothetical protein
MDMKVGKFCPFYIKEYGMAHGKAEAVYEKLDKPGLDLYET